MESLPQPHNPYDWQEDEARRAEREQRARSSGTRQIKARSRWIVGAVLLMALVAIIVLGLLAWIDYFATHPG